MLGFSNTRRGNSEMNTMMNMEGMSGMMGGMGLLAILAGIFLVLGIAALIKYLFFDKRD